jgi:hypothetical protein
MIDKQITMPLDDAKAAPSNWTDTSKAAAQRITRSSKTKIDESLLYEWLCDRMGRGATDDEIQEHFSWTGDYQRPRRWRLVKDGLVYRSTERRRTRSGSKAAVWVVMRP